jgi:hypothetical protein
MSPRAPRAGRQRIQVHRRSALGDVLLITPVLRALRCKYPAAEIVVTTHYPEILRGNPHVDALTGACLLMERDLFLRLGEFETDYHGSGGCEDTDLCFKVLEYGRLAAYCPASVVYHHEGVTRGVREEDHPEDVRNRTLLRRRWGKYITPDISDYFLLAEIEAAEGRTWHWLPEVPAEIVARYDPSRRRAADRPLPWIEHAVSN